MSDKKIIIRNCPAYDYDEEFNYHMCKQPLIPYECSVDDCKDCTDCVLKQIVELCKEDLKPTREWQEGDTVFIEYKKDVHLANNILQLLDIQEVE